MLKLTAEDSDDLTVISAQMQDALVRASDMRLLPKQRQFALVANRFAWDAEPKRERRRSGLSIRGVLGAQRLGFDAVPQDEILSLLSITFTASSEGAGDILLAFSTGVSIKLRVECIDVQMSDMGPRWASQSKPDHGA